MKAAKTRAYNKKHAGTAKHASSGGGSKHKPTAHKKAATAHKQTAHRVKLSAAAAHARSLSLGEGVACCSAEAIAASLRLAGARVSDDDVLELHWRAGGDEDTGVTILAALEAAMEWGLAGYRPTFSGGRPTLSDADALTCSNGKAFTYYRRSVRPPATLLLGLELPGPHAVLADAGRWWSWGKPYDPLTWPDARIEEAWAVTW